MPLTTPEEEPIVATAGFKLLQVPPGSVLLSVVVLPLHTFSEPIIADGNGFTVTL